MTNGLACTKKTD